MKVVLLHIALFVLMALPLVNAQVSNELSSVNAIADHRFAPPKWDYFIYPVPATDEINVKVTKGHVEIHQIIITDEFGNQVMELNDLEHEKYKVDIAELAPGKYFMQIMPEDNGQIIMKRFYVSNR